MALGARLMMRQGQSLVMTPQLLQAIKLLQFSHLELASFVQEELDRNPLLERAEDRAELAAAGMSESGAMTDFAAPEAVSDVQDWSATEVPGNDSPLPSAMTGDSNAAFESDAPTIATQSDDSFSDAGLSAGSWTGAPSGGGGAESPNLEAYVAAKPSLHDYLRDQLALACPDAIDRMIGNALIDGIDEAGYLREDIALVAGRLGTDPERVEIVLERIHGFEPTGVGARDLAECLSLQLIERQRLDPAMQILVANLPLLARREFAQLRKLCAVDEEDMADMVAELRRLDPKPGRAFGSEPLQPVIPDVTVRAASDGTWHVELNSEIMPRILVDQTYAARIGRGGGNDTDRSFLTTCLQNANWLTKSLEQRARTILKVASEIVRQQDAFLAHGIEHLRPLNLRTVADAIGMHESTVSRVTSNKYLSTPRGLFEMKYFFTAAIASETGAGTHSAESVRFRIKQLIDQETTADILSDDAIVSRLKSANIDIARRTVAKYRESLRIPSSVERRREKTAMQ